jgi:hypothetical protein
VFPRRMLSGFLFEALLTEKEDRLIPVRGSHSNVYRHVILQGRGGRGVMGTLSKEPPEIRAKLRVLYETPARRRPLAAHPRPQAVLGPSLMLSSSSRRMKPAGPLDAALSAREGGTTPGLPAPRTAQPEKIPGHGPF